MSERKVLGKYKRNEPRTVRFGPPDDDRTTICISDVLRDIMLSVIESDDMNWSRAEYARQLRMAQSTLNAICSGTREANLEVLERLAALQRQDPMSVFLVHPALGASHFKKALEAGENPWGDLRIRGNTTSEQRERIGLALEACTAANAVERLVELIEVFGESMRERPTPAKK